MCGNSSFESFETIQVILSKIRPVFIVKIFEFVLSLPNLAKKHLNWFENSTVGIAICDYSNSDGFRSENVKFDIFTLKVKVSKTESFDFAHFIFETHRNRGNR